MRSLSTSNCSFKSFSKGSFDAKVNSCFFVFLVGCSKGIVPVSGKLIKGSDPIANVMITLSPEPAAGREFAVGGTDDNGIFTMYTLPSKGVSPGDYKIKLQPRLKGKPLGRFQESLLTFLQHLGLLQSHQKALKI